MGVSGGSCSGAPMGTGRIRLDPLASKGTESVLSRPEAIPGSHEFRVVPETLASLLTRSGSTPLGSQGSN